MEGWKMFKGALFLSCILGVSYGILAGAVYVVIKVAVAAVGS